MLEDKLVKQEPRVEIVPLQVLLDEEDEEWRQMIEDVESGKITRKELHERNCVHWSEGWEVIWPEK